MDAPAFLEESGRTRAARFRECRQRASADPSSDEAIHDLRVAIRRVLAWIAVREALLSPDRRLREARSSLKELMGPLGYSRRLLFEKWMRDAKINDLFEGTGQINRLVIARRILGYSSKELK